MAVDELWGPLEWRLPDAHAIYWAQQGIEDVTKRFDSDGDGVLNLEEEKAAGGDFLKLRRIIYQALQQACMQGTVDRSDAQFQLRLERRSRAPEKPSESYEDANAGQA